MTNSLSHQPLISIIVPCYNYGHLVYETLDSLKQQTSLDWECIVVNDGSTDNTEELIQAYIKDDERYRYIYQENKGLSAARNTGIASAKGDLIQLLDADDLLEPDKLKKQSGFLQQHPEVDIVYGDVKYFYSDAPTVYYNTVTAESTEWMPKLSGKGTPIVQALLQGNIMAVNCPLIRKNVFEKAGLFDVNFPVLEDWEMWLRCALLNVSFHYLDETNTDALVRMHNISMTKNKWRMRLQELEWKESLYGQHPVFREILAYEIDKLRISLLLITLSSLLKGELKAAYRQYMLFRKKVAIADLSQNGGQIILGKVKASFFKKLRHNHQQAIDTQQNPS